MPPSDHPQHPGALGTARRRYDLVVHGATGFVGRQVAACLAAHAQLRGSGLRWALSGRDPAKLAQLQQSLTGPGPTPDVLLADAGDAHALGRLARQARVVLSAAGPFAVHGSLLVAACVRHHTHYVDITGETPWVRDLVDRHHAQAARDGTRIVPCCGFDSVPSDLGVWMLRSAMAQRLGLDCAEVKAAYALRGGLNGGTLASALHLFESGQADALADPYLLNPDTARAVVRGADRDPVRARFDTDFGAWLAPFFMGPVNTRVVRRSAALLDYGSRFRYQEYLRVGRGAVAAASAGALSAAMGASRLALRWGPVRAACARLAPGPGEGPSIAQQDQGGFRCELVARSVNGQMLRGRVSAQGDPGNRATTRMVSEAALALVVDAAQLPGGPGRGGVLTPASALGDVLLGRLRAAGMAFVVDA